MTDRSQAAVRLVATISAVICCLAPLLLVASGVIGTSLFVAISIYLLSPVVAVFVAVVGYGLWRERARPLSGNKN